MKEIIDQMSSWEIVQVFGGLTLVLSTLVSTIVVFTKDWLANRWDKKKQKEIEELKHTNSRTEKMIENVTQSISAIHSSSNEKILQSYEKLWNCMLELRRNIPSAAFMAYTVLTKKELENIYQIDNTEFLKEINHIDFSKQMSRHSEILNEVESVRPFIGQKSWNILFSYQAFIGRAMFLLYAGKTNSKVQAWLDDENFIAQIILPVIEKDKLDKLLESETAAFYNILSYEEMLIQEEVHAQIFGKRITDETLNLAIAFSESIVSMNKEKIGKK